MNQKQASEYLNKLQAQDPSTLSRLEPWEKAVLQNVAATDQAIGQARNRLQGLLQDAEATKEGIAKLSGKLEGFINLLVGAEAERQGKETKPGPLPEQAPLSLDDVRKRFGADKVELLGKDGQPEAPRVESKHKRK